MQKRKENAPKILVFFCPLSEKLSANVSSWLKDDNQLFTIENVPGGGFWIGADTDGLSEKGANMVDRVTEKLKELPQILKTIEQSILRVKEGISSDEDEFKILEEMAKIICDLEIDGESYKAILLNSDGSINEEKSKQIIAGSITAIQVGFFDKNTGNFSNLNDSKFNYFNKYSDEQLDNIYEASPYNREIIDKVREYRKSLKDS